MRLGFVTNPNEQLGAPHNSETISPHFTATIHFRQCIPPKICLALALHSGTLHLFTSTASCAGSCMPFQPAGALGSHSTVNEYRRLCHFHWRHLPPLRRNTDCFLRHWSRWQLVSPHQGLRPGSVLVCRLQRQPQVACPPHCPPRSHVTLRLMSREWHPCTELDTTQACMRCHITADMWLLHHVLEQT